MEKIMRSYPKIKHVEPLAGKRLLVDYRGRTKEERHQLGCELKNKAVSMPQNAFFAVEKMPTTNGWKVQSKLTIVIKKPNGHKALLSAAKRLLKR